MSAEDSAAPRAWNENHPWSLYHCDAVGLDGYLRLRGQRILVRWVFMLENFIDADEGETAYMRGLVYDREGNFYAITEIGEAPRRSSLVKKLTGKAALTWFAQTASWDATFTRELCRAIDNLQFEFMPLVPQRVPAKRQRKRAEAFHEQLLMATALVECVRKLEDDPTSEHLSEACRSASKLHTAIHAPENFKLANS